MPAQLLAPFRFAGFLLPPYRVDLSAGKAWPWRFGHFSYLSYIESHAFRAEIKQAERKIDQLVERILASDSGTLITAYENQVRKLEEQKAGLSDKASRCGRPLASFEDTFRTGFEFLASPYKLWSSDRLEDKRMVLRLAFAGRISYQHIDGIRTADLSLPFKALAGLHDGKKVLVEVSGN